jgi:hypothetical protein
MSRIHSTGKKFDSIAIFVTCKSLKSRLNPDPLVRGTAPDPGLSLFSKEIMLAK